MLINTLCAHHGARACNWPRRCSSRGGGFGPATLRGARLPRDGRTDLPPGATPPGDRPAGPAAGFRLARITRRAVHALFAETILQTYRDSLDCPGLNGVRQIEDIIAGHKASGEFDPALWFLLCEQPAQRSNGNGQPSARRPAPEPRAPRRRRRTGLPRPPARLARPRPGRPADAASAGRRRGDRPHPPDARGGRRQRTGHAPLPPPRHAARRLQDGDDALCSGARLDPSVARLGIASRASQTPSRSRARRRFSTASPRPIIRWGTRA